MRSAYAALIISIIALAVSLTGPAGADAPQVATLEDRVATLEANLSGLNDRTRDALAERDATLLDLQKANDRTDRRLGCLGGGIQPVARYSEGGHTYLDAERSAGQHPLWIVLFSSSCIPKHWDRPTASRAWAYAPSVGAKISH